MNPVWTSPAGMYCLLLGSFGGDLEPGALKDEKGDCASTPQNSVTHQWSPGSFFKAENQPIHTHWYLLKVYFKSRHYRELCSNKVRQMFACNETYFICKCNESCFYPGLFRQILSVQPWLQWSSFRGLVDSYKNTLEQWGLAWWAFDARTQEGRTRGLHRLVQIGDG